MIAAPPPPIVDVRPTIELRTASPVNEVAVDGGRAATLVGETPSWEYVLVWSPKGIVVRPSLACDRQESDLVLAGDRFAHICYEGAREHGALPRRSSAQRSTPRLHTAAFVALAGHGSLIAGSAGRTLWRFDATGKTKLAHLSRAGHRAQRRPQPDPRRRGRNTVLEIVSRTGKATATLKLPHVGGALLRGSHIASIASHRFVLSDLHGKALRPRAVVGDATLVDSTDALAVYSVGIALAPAPSRRRPRRHVALQGPIRLREREALARWVLLRVQRAAAAASRAARASLPPPACGRCYAVRLRGVDTGLAGKGVVVTGASGGIGSACARAFAAEGAKVVVHYHQGRDRAEAIAAELEGAVALGADLTDEAQVDELFAQARAALGSVDVCAAVAGVWPSADEPVWELPLERWEETVRANLTATFLTARAFLPRSSRTATAISSSSARPPGASARPATPTTPRRSLRSRSACCSA